MKTAAEEVGRIHISDALEHFGIDEEGISGMEIFSCKNDEFFREKTGLNQAIGACERSGMEIRKARVIIDFDADFPVIVTRVIPR